MIYRRCIALLLCLWGVPLRAGAEEVRVAAQGDWQRWSLPEGALETTSRGIRPTFVRRDVNAVADAPGFGGGLRGAGTDLSGAPRIMDGDPATAWAPKADDPLKDWWVELDLGRVVSAFSIQVTFDPQSPPLAFFKVLTSDGEPFFSNANSILPGTVRFNGRTNFSFNQEHAIQIDFGLKPLRYIRIQADEAVPGVRIAEVQVESVGDNLSLGIHRRGGGVGIISEVGSKTRELIESAGISNTLIDGDITSYWGVAHRGGYGLQAEAQLAQFEFDLGALFWVDRVRILGDPSGLPPGGVDQLRGRNYAFNFLWYYLFGSDGSRAPDGSLRWVQLGELLSDPKNLQGVRHFDEQFPLQKLRYLRLLFPMTDERQWSFNGRIGTTAEFQIFGEGYPAETVALSPLYDLGASAVVSAVDWEAQTSPGARVELRTRTGNLLEERYVFYNKDGEEVTQKRWEKLIPSFRGPIDTLRIPGSDWSAWSRPYERPGQEFASPGPRRYTQVEARLLSEDPQQAPALESLTLRYGPPLAQETRAEISPVQALPGRPSDFTYYLRATLSAESKGFDQILLQSSAGLDFVGLRLDGAAVAAKSVTQEGGVRLDLPQPVRRSALVEIDFRSTLFLNQTRFDAFLLNSTLGEVVRQQVDVGDASPQVASEAVAVALPADRRLIDELRLSSPLFTPNGDGVGDRLGLEFNLLMFYLPRPLRIDIYDLGGRRLRSLSQAEAAAGRVGLEWDGRDEDGSLVPPGLYLLRVEAQGDAQTETVSRLVGVAY
ncbi:MAG: hypothetical protein HYW07_13575 [Candidatus Latescibacteria bacterium]|nr:hypothetical protein [Candidatus Latescibacterota bacterium]